jgi:molybdopterin synthase catalytic subunit
MRVNVLYFAVARERAGVEREAIDLPAIARVTDLKREIAKRHPALASTLPRMRVAVNREFAEDPELRDGDEIALIPPVAGGIDLARVVSRPIELREAVEAVRGGASGGVVTFTGTVRGESHGKKVVRLEYQAYVAMAEEKLRAIGNEIEARWPGARIAILHRVGILEVGETAVVIAAATPHRKEAFEACSYAIDRLKQEVPIWKKEIFEDGEEWVGMGP